VRSVSFHRAGKPIKTFRRSWEDGVQSGRLPDRLRHDFRRTTVRNLVRNGISERVATPMTGHKTRAVFERYNIVSPGDLADAAHRFDEAANSVTGTITGTIDRESTAGAR
jgi:hypothetical protein